MTTFRKQELSAASCLKGHAVFMGEASRPVLPGKARRTQEEWAALWVQRFGVYQQRRFGPGARANAEQVAAFLRFIAVRC
jgi:hypothetical protein